MTVRESLRFATGVTMAMLAFGVAFLAWVVLTGLEIQGIETLSISFGAGPLGAHTLGYLGCVLGVIELVFGLIVGSSIGDKVLARHG